MARRGIKWADEQRIAEETEASFIVRDHNGQALAYVYFEEEPGRRAAANPIDAR